MVQRLLLVALLTSGLAACAGTDSSNPASTASPTTTPSLPRSLKGYELYSWRVDARWHFALLTGTNRFKTSEEITNGKDSTAPDAMVRVRSVGVEGIKETLTRLPAGEEITWNRGPSNGATTFSLPPKNIVEAVYERCRKVGVTVSVYVVDGVT